MTLIVSYGAGVNSTSMLIGLAELRIRPDAILFADTGAEMPETYAYVRRFSNWLAAHGMPEIVTVQNDGMHKTLERECMTNHTLPSLAYGWKKCSQKYKIRPLDKWVKAQSYDDKPTRAIGYDFGEQHRYIKAPTEDERFFYWYPLVEWKWTRRDCIAAIERAGLCAPPKSACFFCPAMKKGEVIELARTSPDLFARAVEIERNAEGNHTIKGLGRHWSWEDVARLDQAQLRLLPDPPAMACTCRDGWEDDDE